MSVTIREAWKELMARPWVPVSSARFFTALAFLALLLLVLLTSERGFVPILDHANLAFHEAGHIFFGLLGSTMGLYGGTLGQLFFPIVAAASFWWRRQPISFALTCAWLFENLFNIARYMADARARVLPLVGGGGHDWANIFGRWHALDSDTRIARITQVLGWVGLVACVAWLLWRWRKDRRQVSPTVRSG